VPAYKNAMAFCRVHLGKDCFAPHTGQDWSAWMAFVYAVELYCRSDEIGRTEALFAMRALLRSAQRQQAIHATFAAALPAVGDWHLLEEVWPQLGSSFPLPPFPLHHR
jgi:hypothetical protein